MQSVLSFLLSLLLAALVTGELTVLDKANVVIKDDHYTLTNNLFDDGCAMTYDNNPSVIENVGAAFSVDYVDPGGSGMDAYVSGTVGGKKSGGSWKPGNKLLTGMPVLLGDIGYDFRIRWSVEQENAWDADDKWWATINVIFDSGTELSEPVATERLFDIVIQLDRYEQDALQDVSKDDKNTYWWFARNPDGSLHPFELTIDGQTYQWGVRYKFFQNQDWKDDKVHIKFIPVDNDAVAPYIDHPLKVFSDAAKDFLAYVDLPTEEQEKADLRVSDPTLWVKAIAAGYETYNGSSTLKQTELRTLKDIVPPTAVTGFTASFDGSAVQLEWQTHQDPSLHGYSIWRSVDGGTAFSEVGVVITQNAFSDSSVEEPNEYLYYVTAVDRSYNHSPASSVAMVSLVPPTMSPSSQPSVAPSREPTRAPSRQPSAAPSSAPTRTPSSRPSVEPSNAPIIGVDVVPNSPSVAPSSSPSVVAFDAEPEFCSIFCLIWRFVVSLFGGSF